MKNLKTVRNYAKLKDVTTATVYQWIKNGKVKFETIDGKKFVVIK